MISIGEARKILGDEYNQYPDKEIERVCDAAYMFADIFIEGVLDNHDVVANSHR